MMMFTMLFRILVLVLMIGFVSALDVDLDCPDDIYVGEEFECSVEVSDGDGVYDVKIEIDEERDSVLRIWDEDGGWKSGYYYLNNFVRDDVDVRLKILERGRYDVVVKLRQDDEREEFEVGRISVEDAREIEREERSGEVEEDYGVISLGGGDEIIFLNGDVVVENEEWDYISKDGRIVDWLPYGFCLFLIFLVGILVWERF